MDSIGQPAARPVAAATGRRRAPDDTGSSLVEVVLSIGILGTVGVGILIALIGSIRGADRNEKAVAVEARLVTAIELVRSENVAYLPCSTQTATLAAEYTEELAEILPDDGIEVEVFDVTVWDGATLGSTCAGAPTDALQSLRVRATRGVFVQSQDTTKLPGPVIP